MTQEMLNKLAEFSESAKKLEGEFAQVNEAIPQIVLVKEKDWVERICEDKMVKDEFDESISKYLQKHQLEKADTFNPEMNPEWIQNEEERAIYIGLSRVADKVQTLVESLEFLFDTITFRLTPGAGINTFRNKTT